MSSYEISTVAGLATAAQIMARDGTVGVILGGKPATIRFQADSLPSAEAAHNVMITVSNLNNSQIFVTELSKAGVSAFAINVTTSSVGLPSSGTTMFGVGILNINVNDIQREYLTRGGGWEHFTLQHIVNHEMMHAITGLPDGTLHNRITNQVNDQTDGGPARLDYESARCFLAKTPILMADGTEKPIENIRSDDLVMAFEPNLDGSTRNLVPRRVVRTFRNTAQQIIDLRGVKCTPGHVFLTGNMHGITKDKFKTIREILMEDGTIVSQDGQVLRARTGALLGSIDDTPVNIVYKDCNSGIQKLAQVRAGIPIIPNNPKVIENSSTTNIRSLNTWAAENSVDLLTDGSLRTINGNIFDAFNWPSEFSLLEFKNTENWIAQLDGKIYTPSWISKLIVEDEIYGLRISE